MPKLSLEIAHALGQEEALRRLKAKFAAALAEYEGNVSHYTQQWQDHVFSFAFRTLGMAVSGTVAVEHESIKLAADLPLAAMLLRGAIENHLRKEVDQMLASPPADESVAG